VEADHVLATSRNAHFREVSVQPLIMFRITRGHGVRLCPRTIHSRLMMMLLSIWIGVRKNSSRSESFEERRSIMPNDIFVSRAKSRRTDRLTAVRGDSPENRNKAIPVDTRCHRKKSRDLTAQARSGKRVIGPNSRIYPGDLGGPYSAMTSSCAKPGERKTAARNIVAIMLLPYFGGNQTGLKCTRPFRVWAVAQIRCTPQRTAKSPVVIEATPSKDKSKTPHSSSLLESLKIEAGSRR